MATCQKKLTPQKPSQGLSSSDTEVVWLACDYLVAEAKAPVQPPPNPLHQLRAAWENAASTTTPRAPVPAAEIPTKHRNDTMKVHISRSKFGGSALAESHGRNKFDGHCHRLLEDLDRVHAAYYHAETFGGPSLYFHQKALEAARNTDVERFAECMYATLASWGMHRMGQGGSKMCDFGPFLDSLKAVWPNVVALRSKRPENMTADDWRQLQSTFKNMQCMHTATSLVGNSKVMAHALPNLVPPVDREYTLKFLYGRGEIKNNIELEWKTLEEILRGFFYPILASVPFQETARTWMQQQDRFVWDTSELKVIDNLVIGLMKMNRKAGDPNRGNPTTVIVRSSRISAAGSG